MHLSNERWPTLRLRETGTRIQIGPFGSLLHQSDYVHGGVPLVNPTHIIAGRIEPGEGETVDPVTLGRLARYVLKAGDVVMGRRGEMGRCALVTTESEGFLCGSGSLILRPDPSRLSSEFLSAFIGSPDAKAMLERSAQGVTMMNLNSEIVGDLEIPLPPLEEQRRIAAILQRADELRAKRRAALAHLDSLARSIFLDMFSDASGDRFGSRALRDLTSKIGSGATPTGGSGTYLDAGVPLIRSMNVYDLSFAWEGMAFLSEEQAAKLDGVRTDLGDVLLNITGASVARVCVLPRELVGARVNQHVSIIRPNADHVTPGFLASQLAAPAAKNRLLGIGGTGATRQAITKAQLERFVVVVPPLELQVEFDRRVNAVDRSRRLGDEQQGTFDALFDALQHRAFSGTL